MVSIIINNSHHVFARKLKLRIHRVMTDKYRHSNTAFDFTHFYMQQNTRQAPDRITPKPSNT